MFYVWYFLFFRLMVGKVCYVEKDKKVFLVCIFLCGRAKVTRPHKVNAFYCCIILSSRAICAGAYGLLQLLALQRAGEVSPLR